MYRPLPVLITSLQKAPSWGPAPPAPSAWKRPACMTHSSCQKTAMEQIRVLAESAPQAHRSSSAAAPLRPPARRSTSSASSHSLVSCILGSAGVSLSQIIPCKTSVTAIHPPRRSARDCAGSMSMRMEFTSTILFQPRNPKATKPTNAGATRIWLSKRAKGSRDLAWEASSASPPRSGNPTSKHCSLVVGATAPAEEGNGSAAPSLAATCATHSRSAARSKARGNADQSTSRPPPGSGFAMADSTSSGKTADGSAPAGNASRPCRVAQ
mmetsp:Transcript_121236/g.354403  ORF Transcript_121236/g.354403 Transcript_121236/m.354403 type:complete len:268 (-) Transcript_121236:640-1443(-)